MAWEKECQDVVWQVWVGELPLSKLVEMRRAIEVEICYRMKSLESKQLEEVERG